MVLYWSTKLRSAELVLASIDLSASIRLITKSVLFLCFYSAFGLKVYFVRDLIEIGSVSFIWAGFGSLGDLVGMQLNAEGSSGNRGFSILELNYFLSALVFNAVPSD